MAEYEWFRNKLSDATPDKIAKVAELVDLKQEALLTSSEAYHHLRYMGLIEELCRNAEKGAANGEKLSTTEAKIICERVSAAVEAYLRMTAARLSTARNWAALCSHHVIGLAAQPDEIRTKQDLKNYPGRFVWDFDHQAFLVEYLKARGALSETQLGLDQRNEALKTAFTNVLLSQECLLTNLKTGERISLYSYELNPTQHSLVDLDSNAVRKQVERWRLIRDLPQNLSDYRLHRLAKDEVFNDSKELLKELVEKPFDDLAYSDLQNLYDFNLLYKRAQAEMTLGTYYVERRLALAAVMPFKTGENSGSQAVTEALEQTKVDISSSEQKLRRLENSGLPSILTSERRQLLEKYRYQLRAIHQNKNWLMKFLDS